jgi:hypothetical protein
VQLFPWPGFPPVIRGGDARLSSSRDVVDRGPVDERVARARSSSQRGRCPIITDGRARRS